MQVVQEALNNSDLLSNLVLALPIMTHGRNKLKGSGMASVVFALPPPAGPARVGARQRQFVAGATLVTFVGGFSEAQEDVIAWLLDMLEKAQLTPEELAVFDWGKDGTAPRRRLPVLGHSSAMLLLLSLLPATIERPEKLREGGKTLSELLEGRAKEAEEAEYLVDGEGCDDTLCTAAGPVAGPADEGAGAGSGSQGAQEQQPEGGARAELVPGPAPPAKQCKPSAQTKKAEKARRRGTAEEEAEAADNEDNGAEVADRQELLDETGRGRAGGTAEPGGGVSHHSLSQTATSAAQPAARPSRREAQAAAACTTASSSGEPLPHPPATAPPVPVGGQDNLDAAGSSGGRSRPPAAPAARQPRDTRGDVAAGVEAASGAATIAAASVDMASCKVANAESPLAALPLLSPVASSGGSPAGGGSQQPAGVLRNAAAADAAPAEAAGAAAVALAVGAAAAATVEEQEVQQHAAAGSRGPTGGAAAQQHRLPEPQPQTPPPNAAGTPAPYLRFASTPASTPRVGPSAWERHFDAVCKAVWTAVQKEEEAAALGRQPGDELYIRAFHIQLLWLSVALGSKDFRDPQPGSLDDLQRQLVARTRGLPGLPVQALLDKAVQLMSNEGFVAKLRACTTASMRLGEGSANLVYHVERDVCVLRVAKPGAGGWGSFRKAVTKFASVLIRHLRADAGRLGAPVLAFVPVDNGHVPKLSCETFKQLLLGTGKGGGSKCVSIGMVLAYQKPLHDVYAELWAHQVGVWRRVQLQALSYAVLELAHKLNEAKLYHADFKADNLALPDQAVAALDRLTAAPPESDLADFAKEAVDAVTAVALDADGMKQVSEFRQYVTSDATIDKHNQACHKGYLPPVELELNELQEQSFKAALVVETLASSMPSAPSASSVVRVGHVLPERWKVTCAAEGRMIRKAVDKNAKPLPIPDAAKHFSAELVQVLGSLRTPLPSLRWTLQARLSRVRSLATAMAARTIGRAKSSQPGGGGLLPLHEPQADVSAIVVSPPDLGAWATNPTDEERLMAVYLDTLFEAAHGRWPANGPGHSFLLLLLETAVRRDAKRTCQLRDKPPSPRLMMCELSYLYHGRSLLHLLMASGNTEAMLTLLRTLHAAGAVVECRVLLAHPDKNGDTAAMLAAVHGRLETLEALVGFVRERLGDTGDSGWLEWLEPQPELRCDLGGILAIICRQYNDRNTGLSDRLSYSLPTVQLLAPPTGAAGSDGAGAGEGARGSNRDEELAAVARQLAEERNPLKQPALAVPSGSNSRQSAAAPGSSDSAGSMQQSPQASCGPDPHRGTWAGLLRALLQLPKDARLERWGEEMGVKASEVAEKMLLAQSSADLGGNTAFHLHAAMAGDMWALYSHVVELYGEELGRKCLQAENAEKQTPVEVLLQCHGVMCSKPGCEALLGTGRPSEAPSSCQPPVADPVNDISGIRSTVVQLRSFLDNLASRLPGLQCSKLQDQLDEAVERLLCF